MSSPDEMTKQSAKSYQELTRCPVLDMFKETNEFKMKRILAKFASYLKGIFIPAQKTNPVPVTTMVDGGVLKQPDEDELKTFWKELYKEFFAMDVDIDIPKIPYFKFPGGYDLIIVFPISTVDLFKHLSNAIGLHDYHTYTKSYFTRRPELSTWDDPHAQHVRDTNNGPYAVWVPKLHNYSGQHNITAADITLKEYLLQLVMVWKSKKSLPTLYSRVMCAGTKSNYGLPTVELRPNRFNAFIQIKTERVYIVGGGTITLPGFPAKEVPKII